MNTVAHQLHFWRRALTANEDGQDLVEYTLIIALLALAAIAGLGSIATALSSELTTIAASV